MGLWWNWQTRWIQNPLPLNRCEGSSPSNPILGFTMNRLCNSRVFNHNSKSPISHYILLSVRDYNDYQGGTYIDEVKSIDDLIDNESIAVDDIFYRIYGEKGTELVYIAEFFDLKKAKEFLFNISGEYPVIISY
jgi:hypothetical protein